MANFSIFFILNCPAGAIMKKKQFYQAYMLKKEGADCAP